MRPGLKLVSICSGATALGALIGLALLTVELPALDEWVASDRWLYRPVLAFWTLLVLIGVLPVLSRSREPRILASGFLLGFDGILVWAYPDRPISPSCGELFNVTCFAVDLEGWRVGILAGFIVAAALLVLASRSHHPATSSLEQDLATRLDLADARSLTMALAKRLGVALVIDAIEPTPPVRIRALLTSGRQNEEVTATGPTEQEAWLDLARMMIASRRTNEKHIPMWGPGV